MLVTFLMELEGTVKISWPDDDVIKLFFFVIEAAAI
jgi:hypothetical protein